jgi:cytoskeleton protein RodZ
MTVFADPLQTQIPAAVRAGADLSAARKRLGRPLDEIAADLRIRRSYLQALEDGRVSSLPGNAYALAYVRSYSRALGLDPEEMVRRFKAEAADVGRRTTLRFPIPMPVRELPASAIVLLGVVLSVGAYVGWYRLSAEGELPPEAVSQVPERLAPLAEQALPPNLSADRSSGVASAASRDQIAAADGRNDSLRQVVPEKPVAPVTMISPTSAAAAAIPSPLPDEVLAPEAPGAIASTANESRIVLHANADAWIQARERNGTVLLNRTMKAGEIWPVPPHANLLLTTGNAGGTEIVLDGATTPSLGPSGTVRRDMPLDPELIKDGKLAASLLPQLGSSRPRQ